MASRGNDASLFTDDYLNSFFDKLQQERIQSTAKDAEQKSNEKTTQVEDSGNAAEPDVAQNPAEPKYTKDSADPEEAENLEEPEDDENLEEPEDDEFSQEPEDDDQSSDNETNVHGDAAENKMEAPICLIENTANGKLVVNPEAIDILSRITQPVVVVAIVGMYRTGKSYLMNKLAGAQKGFNLGSTVQSETKGIWMWCVPHPKKKNHTLVLLDTEGLGDVEKGDSKNDTFLFSLALLLSSALVYNSKGTIDQDALDKLKFVGDISNFIKVKTGKLKEENENDYSTHFPIFVWTVRDFLLELIIDGQQVSADDYMENALKLKTAEQKKKLTKKDAEFNKVRSLLRKFFGKRKCFTFDLPTSDKFLLRKLEEISDKELNPEFVAQSKRFCHYIFKNAEEKRLDVTVPITGDRLGELAKIYTDAITSSKVACMEEAVASLSDKENQIAVQEAIENYQNKMKEVRLPTETTDDFNNVSRQYEEEARQMFLKRSFKDESQTFLKEFLKNLNNTKNEFRAMNEKSSREISEALIKKYSADFEKSLIEGAYLKSGGHGKYIESLLAIEISYDKESGKGLKGEEVLQEYVKSKKTIELAIIQEDNALSQREKEAAEEKNRKTIEEMEEKMKKMEEEHRARQMQEEQTVLRETIKDLVEKGNEERRMWEVKLAQVMREKERERDSLMRQAANEEAQKYQRQIDELNRSEKNRSKCTIS